MKNSWIYLNMFFFVCFFFYQPKSPLKNGHLVWSWEVGWAKKLSCILRHWNSTAFPKSFHDYHDCAWLLYFISPFSVFFCCIWYWLGTNEANLYFPLLFFFAMCPISFFFSFNNIYYISYLGLFWFMLTSFYLFCQTYHCSFNWLLCIFEFVSNFIISPFYASTSKLLVNIHYTFYIRILLTKYFPLFSMYFYSVFLNLLWSQFISMVFLSYRLSVCILALVLFLLASILLQNIIFCLYFYLFLNWQSFSFEII